MTYMLYFALLLAALIIIALVFVNIATAQGKAWVRERLFAIDGLPDEHKRAAWTCFEDAALADPLWRKLRDKVAAPFVLLIPLLRLPRDANELPAKYTKWANNVSINGDGAAVLRDGKWVELRDIGWQAGPFERVYRYDDPEYTGDAYYAKGHHPRSFWARYIWLAFRNVASQQAVNDGIDVTQRPEVLAGSDPKIDGTPQFSTAQQGWMLLWDGADSYQWRSTDKLGPLCLWINVGYKLDIVRNSPSGTGRAAVIATWASLKKWGGS